MAAKQIKREKATSTKGHYITNATLLPEVIKAKKLGKVTDELARMFIKITERYSKKSNFVGYSFREDMVSVALINLCVNGLKFNDELYDNPFAFYTTMIHRSFLQYMADEKKHRNIRDELILEIGANPSNSFSDSAHDDYTKEHNSDDFYHRAPINIEVNKVGNPYDYHPTQDANIVAPNFNVEQKKRTMKNRPFTKKKKIEEQVENVDNKKEKKTSRKKQTIKKSKKIVENY